jgi:hypothetical protein
VPTTSPVTVADSHLRWPIRLFGRAIFRLITASGGDYVSTQQPDFFDATGQPVALTAELMPGSVIRIEHDDHGALKSIQLLAPVYQNPFATGPP